ncbi:MAG: acetate--CoA ligase family protein [Dethiobacter sp.]|jgi:acetyltransferase|nr:acetate--CoA ligase family protein [Dethiobacter sp.]
MKYNPLHQLMNPESIAIVGAGNNPMKMGTMQALSILKDGYGGKFLPVHRKDKTVLGHTAYASVLDLPETPDLAMLVVPTDQVIPLLEEFGKIGTKHAVIISAGFRETGPEGELLEERLKETAGKFGIRFLGPNCIGLLNSQLSLNMTVFSHTAPPGILGMASQSGTYVTQTFPYLKSRGIHFSKAISVGNEADIDIVDVLEYLGEDEETRAIALYIEGISDGRRFIETAQKITPYKPVIAQYVGGSTAGARAGASHTGSMAGPDYLYDGAFKQAGIIRVHSVEELYSHGWALATLPPLKGGRVGVVTNSGGPGTAIAHTCDVYGLEVPAFSEELQQQIKTHIPAVASSANPVDLTFFLNSRVLSSLIPELIIESGEVDCLIIHGAMSSGMMKEVYPHVREALGNIALDDLLATFKQDISTAASMPGKNDFPVVISSFFGREDSFTAAYQDQNIPVFDSPEKAARGMASLLRHKEIRERGKITHLPLPVKSTEAEKIISQALQKGQKALDEYSAKKIMALYRIPVTSEKIANSADEAVETALLLGLPVAVKACSPQIMHKTERGLVHLNLKQTDEVRQAFNSIKETAGEGTPVIVSEMVKGDREFTAGMTRFPGFGPAVLFGLGGVFTEALKDVTFRIAPLGLTEAQEMAFDIRAKKLLCEFRGMPAADISAIGEILQALGTIALLHPQVAEIDINPIIIRGNMPVVVDALVVIE